MGVAKSASPPATPVGDLPAFLHIQVKHVVGEPGSDRLRLPVVLSGRVEVTSTVDPDSIQPAGDGTHTAMVATDEQFGVDAAGGQFAIAAEGIDQFYRVGRELDAAGCGCAGAVFKPFGTVGSVAVDTFRQGRADDAGFGSGVSDGTAVVDHASDETLSSFRGQWGVSVDYWNGSLSAEWFLLHHPSCSPWARSFIPDWCLQRHDPQQLAGTGVDLGIPILVAFASAIPQRLVHGALRATYRGATSRLCITLRSSPSTRRRRVRQP